MYGENSYGVPLGLAMALSSNTVAMSAFLNMSNEKQDAFIEKAKSVKTKREMQMLVDKLSLS